LIGEMRPECPRACRVRLAVGAEGRWSAEYLLRLDALGIGRGDRRRFRALFLVQHPDLGPLLTVPANAGRTLQPRDLLNVDPYAELVSEDRWGAGESWPKPSPEESREFDDHELLFRLYLEHEELIRKGQPARLVIASAVTPRSLAKIDALRRQLEAGAERNPSLPGWVLYRGRLLHEANLFEEARPIIESIPGSLAGLDALLKLAADHYFETGEFDKALELCRRWPKSVVGREAGRTAEAAKKQWEQELEARKADREKVERNPRLKLLTERGEIVVELFEDEAPIAVRNFVDLALTRQFYDRLRFTAVGGVLVKLGDPRTRPGAATKLNGPGWFLETDPKRRHLVRGALAMIPDRGRTHGSQFVISVVPLPADDPKYVVFGRVVEGMDVVQAIEQDDRLAAVEKIHLRTHAYKPFGRVG
ncbi:MAG: peptidylprolyl isomerase, partial [Planctomycetota bacterium]